MATVTVMKKKTSSRRVGSSATTLEPAKATPSRRKKVPVEREYVGIDLHRRRSVIIRKNTDGELLSKVHIDNDPMALTAAVAAAGPDRRSSWRRRSVVLGRGNVRWAFPDG